MAKHNLYVLCWVMYVVDEEVDVCLTYNIIEEEGGEAEEEKQEEEELLRTCFVPVLMCVRS